MAKLRLFDLEKHFAFYGAYHSNPVNVFMHMLFVWPIAFFTLIPLYFTPSLFNLPQIDFSLFGNHVTLLFNVGFLVTVIYSLVYVLMDVKAGSLAALVCVVWWIASSFVAITLGLSLAWKVALAGQIFCWTGQFIGHGVFEKRSPAFLDSFFQAFVMAPFFVLLETLQFFGYEPYPGFHASVQSKIDADILEWKEKKKN